VGETEPIQLSTTTWKLPTVCHSVARAEDHGGGRCRLRVVSFAKACAELSTNTESANEESSLELRAGQSHWIARSKDAGAWDFG